MEANDVSTFMNSPRNNTPQCIAPVGDKPILKNESLSLDTPADRWASKDPPGW
jgi:hypothetical protein